MQKTLVWKTYKRHLRDGAGCGKIVLRHKEIGCADTRMKASLLAVFNSMILPGEISGYFSRPIIIATLVMIHLLLTNEKMGEKVL
jgi:hypothetical protein